MPPLPSSGKYGSPIPAEPAVGASASRANAGAVLIASATTTADTTADPQTDHAVTVSEGGWPKART